MDQNSPKEEPNAARPQNEAELLDGDVGATAGMMHVGAAAEDDKLLVSNGEDDE